MSNLCKKHNDIRKFPCVGCDCMPYPQRRGSSSSSNCYASSMDSVPIPKKLLEDLVQLWSIRGNRPFGSPNHCHDVRGIWDSDNGDLAGKPCAECAIYDAARQLLQEA